MGALLKTLDGHNNRVNAVTYRPDGLIIASASKDKTVKLWDAAKGILLQTLTGHDHYVLSVCYSPDGMTVSSGSFDETIKIWDVSDVCPY
jgi:WD40 repeat protein